MFIKLRVRNIRNNTQTKKEYQRAISEYQSTVSQWKRKLILHLLRNNRQRNSFFITIWKN